MYRLIVSLAVAAVIVCGCGRSSPPAKVAGTQLITSFGTNHDPVTGWTVTVGETNGISIGPRTSTKGFGIVKVEVTSTTSVRPPNWNAHPGWFAFAENQERVWVFNGQRDLFLLTATPEEEKTQGDPHKSQPVPAEVAARLPESLRKEIPATHESKPTPPAQ